MNSAEGFASASRSIGQAVFLGLFEELLPKLVENVLEGVQGLELVLGTDL